MSLFSPLLPGTALAASNNRCPIKGLSRESENVLTLFREAHTTFAFGYFLQGAPRYSESEFSLKVHFAKNAVACGALEGSGIFQKTVLSVLPGDGTLPTPGASEGAFRNA
jgi:hypothetical protein